MRYVGCAHLASGPGHGLAEIVGQFPISKSSCKSDGVDLQIVKGVLTIDNVVRPSCLRVYRDITKHRRIIVVLYVSLYSFQCLQKLTVICILRDGGVETRKSASQNAR